MIEDYNMDWHQAPTEIQGALKKLLVKIRNVFAWSQEDMSGIDNAIIEHHHYIDPTNKKVQ